MEKIRLILVDDDLDWLKVITDFLNGRKDFLIVGTATNRSGAFKIATSVEFDVMLLDISLEGIKLDGINAAIDILSVIDKPIIMLTSLSEAEIVTKAFAAGAVNFVLKSDYEKIPENIINSMKSNVPMNTLLQEFRRLKKEEILQVLSHSEKEIFRLAEKGYKRSEICTKLFKSENTIKSQIKTILNKLNCSNIKEAVKKVKLISVFNKDI